VVQNISEQWRYNMTYGLNQREWLKANPTVKVGTNILIFRSYSSFTYEERDLFAWKRYGNRLLDSLVGKELNILNIDARKGILLQLPEEERAKVPYYYEYNYCYPYYCLGKDLPSVKEVYIILPDGTEQKVDTLKDGYKLVSKLTLKLEPKDKVWFKIGGMKIDALNTNNQYLGYKPVDFLKNVTLF
jgi:hypothetical protein